MRPSGRAAHELRAVRITPQFIKYAEGSVLIEYGETKVVCTASVEDRVPLFLKGKGSGWVTAEYGMLPRATHTRSQREATRGRASGRTMEIQRLIGRALRSVVDLNTLGDRTITLDCDVIQADGGTRTAAITGGFVALAECIRTLATKGLIKKNPLHGQVASVSVGIYKGQPIIDLDYLEDSEAEADLNVVMNDGGAFVEIQGTAEGHAFRQDELLTMLDLARGSITQLLEKQRQVLGLGGSDAVG